MSTSVWILIVVVVFVLGLLAIQAFSKGGRASTPPSTSPAVTPPTATGTGGTTPPTPAASAVTSVVPVQAERKPWLSLKWLVLVLALWTVIITTWFLYTNPENWKRDLTVAGVVLSVLLIVGTPHLPKSEEKKKDGKGYTFAAFVGHVLKFLITVPISLFILGALYYWIVLPAYRSTYGIEEPRGQGVSKTFPYKISIPFSPDPSGAYSAPLHVPDGGKIQFDWNRFPKNVWLDICWNGKDMTRMYPVNHPLWVQPSGTNIKTMEFKAVLVPAGTTTVELGYSLK